MNLAQINNNDKGSQGPSKLERAAQMLGMVSTVASIGGGLKGLTTTKPGLARMDAGYGTGPYDPNKYSLGGYARLFS